MDARLLSNGEYVGLKTATRRLVKACGGLESAASVTRIAASTLGDYQLQHSRFFVPVDVIADLEHDCGTPFVTQQLARLAGCVLLHLPDVTAAPDYALRLSCIGKEVSDVFARASSMLADGRADEREKSELVVEVDQAVEALAALRQMLSPPCGKARHG